MMITTHSQLGTDMGKELMSIGEREYDKQVVVAQVLDSADNHYLNSRALEKTSLIRGRIASVATSPSKRMMDADVDFADVDIVDIADADVDIVDIADADVDIVDIADLDVADADVDIVDIVVDAVDIVVADVGVDKKYFAIPSRVKLGLMEALLFLVTA